MASSKPKNRSSCRRSRGAKTASSPSACRLLADGKNDVRRAQHEKLAGRDRSRDEQSHARNSRRQRAVRCRCRRPHRVRQQLGRPAARRPAFPPARPATIAAASASIPSATSPTTARSRSSISRPAARPSRSSSACIPPAWSPRPTAATSSSPTPTATRSPSSTLAPTKSSKRSPRSPPKNSSSAARPMPWRSCRDGKTVVRLQRHEQLRRRPRVRAAATAACAAAFPPAGIRPASSLDGKRNELYVANIKGNGSRNQSWKGERKVKGKVVFGYNSHDHQGTVSLIKLPTPTSSPRTRSKSSKTIA